jgi:hypothetical protein
MVTESVDKVKVRDERYMGYWQGATVILPFLDYDLAFVVFDESVEKKLCWINIYNGFALVTPK